jgi:hypothetical protein
MSVRHSTRLGSVILSAPVWALLGWAAWGQALAPSDGIDPCDCPAHRGCLVTNECLASREDRSWHLLQKQYDGLIRSVQHGLTKRECEFARARIMGEPATDEEKAEAKAKAEKEEALRVAAKAKWLTDRPGCIDYYKPGGKECDPSYDPKTGKTNYFSSSPGIQTWGTLATNITSAECFQ